ncbi:MAG: methylmalonyl Co-A mutase-associated GTPase MeaB, partial [Flavobacteriales bacterium]|nr:methylmalonyl Co-A mutase-associated GTPase MeaB [Flavobacteriales bacterium]
MAQKSSKTSALQEKDGVMQPETVNSNSVKLIQQFRRKSSTAEELVQGILKGNITDLSRAITLVESTNPEHL